MSSSQTAARIRSQLDTPKEWILSGKMFRIKSWEIEEDEIRELFDSIIKHEYKINLIRGKEGDLKGITLLYLTNPEDVEKVRTTLLITSSGTELRKVNQLPRSEIISRTIKTTAPLWITHERILRTFSKYNSDTEKYDLLVDHKPMKGVQYPLIRFHPTIVERNGKDTKVNVVYVEFSPKKEAINDSFIALSMEHRVETKNNLSGEVAILIFDKWTVEKTLSLSKKSKSKTISHNDEKVLILTKTY